MGQMAMGLAGSAIGGSTGGMIGSMLGALMFGSKGGSNSTDLKFSSSAWGEFIPELYGTARLPGKLLWCGPTSLRNTSKKSGKKGSSSNATDLNCSFAVGWCAGPGVTVNRMWADGNLFYDRTNPQAVQNNPYTKITFFDGGEDQTPVPQIIEWVRANVPAAPNAAPAFRGMAYAFFDQANIGPFGNRIPNLTAECTKNASSKIPTLIMPTVTGTLNIGLTGAGPTPTTNIEFDGAIDWATQRMFTTQWDAGIRVTDIASNRELSQGSLPGVRAVAISLNGSTLFATDSSSKLYALDANRPNAPFGGGLDFSNIYIDGIDLSGFGFGLLSAPIVTPVGMNDVVFLCGAPNFGGVGGAYNTYAVFLGQSLFGGPALEACTNPTASGLDNPAISLPCGTGFGNTATSICCLGPFTGGSASLMIVSFGGAQPANIYFITAINATFELKKGAGGGPGVIPSLTVGTSPIGFVGGRTLSPSWVVFDVGDDTLLIGDGTNVFKCSTDGKVKWEVPCTVAAGTLGMLNQSLVNGYFGWWEEVDGTFHLIDTSDGHTVWSGGPVTTATPSGYQAYETLSNSIIMSNGDPNFLRVYLNKGGSDAIDLSDILSDVCTKANLDPSQYDVSAITDQITGYVVTRQGSSKNVIQQLSSAFFFDVVESDYKLKFVPRGQAPVATLTQDDLAEESQKGDAGDFWVHNRAQQQDIPSQINIKFIDQDNAYQDNAAYSKRTVAPVATVAGKEKQTVDIPVVMDLTKAQQVAHEWLYTLWVERDSYKSSTGWQYIPLDATDNVVVNLDNGSSYTVRMTSSELGGDYSIKMGFVGEDIQTFVPSATAAAMVTGVHPPKTISASQFAKLFFLDAPLLADVDETGGTATRVYYTQGPYASWFGGAIFNSLDGEAYSEWAFVTNKATWGTSLDALAAPASPFRTDLVNTVTVILNNQTTALTALSDIDFRDFGNMAMLGDELIQFQNVSINADGSFTLSKLLRGRRGTEWAVGQHAAGDIFIFLGSGDINNTKASLSKIGVQQFFKLVSAGQTLDNAPAIPVTYKGYDLKPYAPVNFSLAVSGSNRVVSWVRRTRYGGGWNDGIGVVTIGEFDEEYDAYVLAAPYDPVASAWAPPVTHLRVFTALAAPTFTYLAADMISDGFTPATDTLHVVVFQKSAAIGAGWPGAADIPPL